MTKKFLKYGFAALLVPALTGCLDYDIPSDEFSESQKQVDATVYSGDYDKLDYEYQPTEEKFDSAYQALEAVDAFGMWMTAQYYLLGNKDGTPSAPHSYQYIYSGYTDNIAGYTVCINSSFMSAGLLESTLSYNQGFNDGAYSKLLAMKSNLANTFNNPASDEIVELKAIMLLMYDIAAQEATDIYGTLQYADHKANKADNPFTFLPGADIYVSIIENLNDINACLANYQNRPDWYKERVEEIMLFNDALTQNKSIETWRRLANSLKLRMAMHMIKVDPEKAKTWAEEAVTAGVIDMPQFEVGENPLCDPPVFGAGSIYFIMHSWNDTRVNASFVSMLTSLQHPYIKYMFTKNSGNITNQKTGEVLPANSKIVGVRAGLMMDAGQNDYNNRHYHYSQFDGYDIQFQPLYVMKQAEVDFLRAEGALRGWNMGGTASYFYEQGIRHADCGEKFFGNEEMDGVVTYDTMVDDYLAVENAVPYKHIDPLDPANDIDGVTTIGVKWNDGDSQETKLEKIITQKYIALFPNSYEAWSEMRRTGYPKTFPIFNPQMGDPTMTYGDTPKRLLLPTGNILAGTEDAQNTGVKALGGDDRLSTRVFWDTEDPNF